MNKPAKNSKNRRNSTRFLAAGAGLAVLASVIWGIASLNPVLSTGNPVPNTGTSAIEAANASSVPPADTRPDNEISDEALKVRESGGVENSFGVNEAPREPEPEPSVEAKLAEKPQQILKPTALDAKIRLQGDVQIELGNVEAVQAEAKMPGEISGPAVKVPVTISNQSQEPFLTRGVVTDVFFGKEQLPGIPLFSGEDNDFPIKLAPETSATAFFVVVVPESAGKTIRVTVNYQATEPVAVFEGSRPGAVVEEKKR